MVDGEEHNLNDLVAIYESDLMDKYLVDQELMLSKQTCSPEERPDSLVCSTSTLSAMISAFLIYFASVRLIAHSLLQAVLVKGVSPHCAVCATGFDHLRAALCCHCMLLMNIHYGHAVNYDKTVDIFLKVHQQKIELSNLI